MIAGNGTVPYYIQFNCDASATAITNAFSAIGGPNTTVIVNQYGSSQYGSTNYSIGYSDHRTIGKNWYRPIVMSTPTGVHVSLTTLQEGGYANSHYNATYSVTPLIQSLWVRPIGKFIPCLTDADIMICHPLAELHPSFTTLNFNRI